MDVLSNSTRPCSASAPLQIDDGLPFSTRQTNTLSDESNFSADYFQRQPVEAALQVSHICFVRTRSDRPVEYSRRIPVDREASGRFWHGIYQSKTPERSILSK